MSGQNNNDGTFNIFNDGALNLGSTDTPNPFVSVSAQPPNENTGQAEAGQLPPETPAVSAGQAAPAQSEPAITTPVQNASSPGSSDAEPENPLAAAVAQAEVKQAAVTADALFSKPPVFEYAGATEDITDTEITFEQLRIEKAKDFPELDDGKRVTWTMEYCTIVKTVPAPSKTLIGALKKEIENSKAFLDALKKAKDKNPICKVKPKITAQSKGIAGYKGIFTTLEEADSSDKCIRIVPARDGHVYEIRCTEAGKFIARTKNIPELSGISAGFIPALPPVPCPLFSQILSFFRYYMRDGRESEVMAYICWDKERQEYVVSVPIQKVGKAHISVVIPPDEDIDTERYIHVADIHSHNSMPAFFSKTDDHDERATRVYIVVGRLDAHAPEISARISVGGRFVPISIRSVIDIPCELLKSFGDKRGGNLSVISQLLDCPDDSGFPPDWISMVSVMNDDTLYPVQDRDPLTDDYSRTPLLSWLMGRFRIRREN